MNDKSTSILKSAAKLSWKIALIALLLGYFTKDIDPNIGTAYIVIALFILGLLFSVVGLFGKKSHGFKASVLPALIGLILNGASLALIIQNVFIGYGDRYAEIVAKEANKELPEMIDQHTKRTSAISEGNKVIYNHNLINYTIEEINIDELSKNMETSLNEHLCSSSEVTDSYLSKGIVLVFRYYDKNEQFITNISISHDKCVSYRNQNT